MIGGKHSLSRTASRSSRNLRSAADLTCPISKRSTPTSFRICRTIDRANCAAIPLAGASFVPSEIRLACTKFTMPTIILDRAQTPCCATSASRPASPLFRRRPYPRDWRASMGTSTLCIRSTKKQQDASGVYALAGRCGRLRTQLVIDQCHGRRAQSPLRGPRHRRSRTCLSGPDASTRYGDQ